ncbi:MAG: beta-lactamase family protein, partial [Gemmatimonadetes bacterium]|nr:beta-lactamase family protein [Gemmatimonadota bacterium]
MTRLVPLAFVAAIAAPLARAQETSPTLSEPELIRSLQAYADSLAGADRFSGVVLLAKGSAPVFQRAWGLADREAGRPNTAETRFNLGSINKAFTATAIRQLAAQGRLSLDDTLLEVLPDYPNPDVARRITIRQLLDHSSGIGGNIFAAPAGKTRAALRANGDFIPLFAGEPLQFPPGSRRAYSNAGYVVLGSLIERLSGTSYYAYVRTHIFEPAGMTQTDSYAIDSLPPNTALGYTRGGPGAAGTEPLRRNRELMPGRGNAAGGGYSTAADLLRFLTAAAEGRISGAPRGGVGVAGGAPGVNAIVEADPDGGYRLIVLANQDPPVAEQIARKFRELLGE